MGIYFVFYVSIQTYRIFYYIPTHLVLYSLSCFGTNKYLAALKIIESNNINLIQSTQYLSSFDDIHLIYQNKYIKKLY